MVAGEASGDQLGAHLIAALKARRPALRFAGIGGPRMTAQGFDAHVSMDQLAVRGYTEALRHYRRIARIRRELGDALLAERPGLFIGVDASDFNLDLERRLKEAGIPAVHYVSPSIWAWRGWRVKRVARSATHLLAMFPFEPRLYERTGLPVTYVGHPLADVIPLQVNKDEARVQLRLPPRKLIIALLPGSRRSELEYMAAAFVLAAHRLRQEVPEVHFVCPMASRETRDLFETALWKLGAQDWPIKLLFGHAQEALAACDGALVASGTATLEAALLKTPMVIAYRMSPWSWRLMKRMRYQPWVGLPNVLAGSFVVPEFLQDDATPDNLAQALGNLVEDQETCRRIESVFTLLHEQLRQNSSVRAAEAIVQYLNRKDVWTSAPQAV